MPKYDNLGQERPDFNITVNPWDVLGLDPVYHARITTREVLRARR